MRKSNCITKTPPMAGSANQRKTKAMPTGGSLAKTQRRVRSSAKPKVGTTCRHCQAADCTVHCQATKNGQHDVETGDMHVADSDPTVVVVEIVCDRCGDRANAVVVESNFTWEGQWRDESSCVTPGRATR